MRPVTLLSTSLVLALAAACGTVGEDYVEPEFESAEMTEWNGRLDGVLTAGDLDPEVLASWWTTLGDPELDALVARAATANLDLRTAGAQLRAARAQRGIGEAAQGPVAGARAGASTTEVDAGSSELYSAGLDASWELDLFGGIERGIEAAQADLEAAEEARRDVLVSVLAEVALNYVELRTLQRRIELVETNLGLQEEGLVIVRAKYDAGAVTRLDLDRTIASLEGVRALVPSLRQQEDQVKNRLAVLLGQAPGALEGELRDYRPLALPGLEVAVGVPAEVLRRRPDVRRSERQLAAETARVGVAIADLYPKLSLTGTVGLESGATSSLFESAARLFTLGSRLQWNLFDRGRTRQQIEIQNARQEEALIGYERSILLALEDVQNAVTAFTQEQIRHRSLVTAEESATRAAALAQSRYASGDTDYLAVIDADRARLAAQDDLALSEGTILADLVRLYKALGGGWTPEDPR